MSSSRLIRLSGLALLLAGALVAIPTLFHPDTADPRAFASAAWLPVHSLLLGGVVLMLFGLVGLYRVQAESAGAAGLIGFALAFAGGALVVAVLTVDAFVLPALAASAPALLDESGPLLGGPLGLVFLLAGGSFALGSILLGFATARAAVLPRWAGALLLVGGPLLALTPPLPQLVGTLGALLTGLSFAWCGYAILARAGASALRSRAAM
jgi:hypothetical protein